MYTYITLNPKPQTLNPEPQTLNLNLNRFVLLNEAKRLYWFFIRIVAPGL